MSKQEIEPNSHSCSYLPNDGWMSVEHYAVQLPVISSAEKSMQLFFQSYLLGRYLQRGTIKRGDRQVLHLLS